MRNTKIIARKTDEEINPPRYYKTKTPANIINIIIKHRFLFLFLTSKKNHDLFLRRSSSEISTNTRDKRFLLQWLYAIIHEVPIVTARHSAKLIGNIYHAIYSYRIFRDIYKYFFYCLYNCTSRCFERI